MSGITIKEYGLAFVGACLREYLGGSWPIALILLLGIAVSILLVLTTKKKEMPLEIVDARDYEREKYESNLLPGPSTVTWLFLSVILVCAVTVCNPFLVRALIPKLGMTTVYYRFFWIIPITFGAAYYIAKAIGSIRKKLFQAAALVLLIGVMAFVMPLNPGIKNLRIPSNVYKVDGAIPVLCEAIHEDFEKSEAYQEAVSDLEKVTDRNSKKWLKKTQELYPVCVFPSQLEFAVRQYDPTIRILFNRNLRLYYEGNTSTGISYGSKDTRYMRRKLILDALYGRDPSITSEEFMKEMEKTKTRYLIAEENLVNGGFLVNSGCTQLGVIAGYTVFRFGA